MIRRLLDSPVPALAGLCLLLLADGAGLVRLSLLASLVHESGHILAYLFLLGRWPPLRLTLSGIGLRADGLPLSRRQESLLLAAGPLANFVCCGALALLIAFRASWGRYFFLAVFGGFGAGDIFHRLKSAFSGGRRRFFAVGGAVAIGGEIGYTIICMTVFFDSPPALRRTGGTHV